MSTPPATCTILIAAGADIWNLDSDTHYTAPRRLQIEDARIGRSTTYWYWERDGVRYAVKHTDVLGWRDRA